MRRSLLLALAVSLALPASSEAWCRTTTDRSGDGATCNTLGVPLAWKRRCHSYALDERGASSMPTATVLDVLARSFGHWEQVACSGRNVGFDFREASKLARCQEAEYSSRDGNVNVVAFIDDFPQRMLMPSAYAVTIVWHSETSGEIYDADILVNEEMGPFGVCPSNGCTDGLTVDLENVITHEAGHFLGLSHSADDESTMYFQAERGEVEKRSLGADDVAGLCAAYPAGSLPDRCSYTPRHGRDLNCENESSGRCTAAPSPAGPDAKTPAALSLLAGFLAVLARRARRAR